MSSIEKKLVYIFVLTIFGILSVMAKSYLITSIIAALIVIVLMNDGNDRNGPAPSS